MSDSDVQVKFGAQVGGLNAGIGEAKSAISGFSEDVLKLNPHLRDALGNLDKAAEGAGKLSHATAGVTREFLVLGHEAVTGNFARMAGSSLVLANRMGVLQNIIKGVTLESVGWAAAIIAIVAGVGEWIAADERLAQAENSIRGAMELNNQSLSYNKEIVERNIERLRILADVSASTANEIGISFARAGNLSVELKNNLIGMVGDFAAATGKDAPKAAEELIKMFSDPKRGAEELARTFTGVLTPAQLQTIERFADSGKVIQAQAALFDALGAKIDDFRINHLTFLQKELERFRDSWVAAFNGDIKLNTSSLEAAFRQIQGRPTALPTGQQDAAAAQEKQNQLNVALEKGYEIEQRSGLLTARRNALLEKQAGLVAAANAAASQGDTQGSARFTQDAAEVQEEINNLRAKGAKRDVEAEMQAIQEKLTINKIYLGEKKDILQAEVDAGKLTKAQEIADLKALTEQEYALDSAALQQKIQLSGLSVIERQRVNNKFLTLQAQHARDMAALDLQAAAAQQATIKKTQEEYKSFFDTIDRSMDEMLKGVLQGTQTWQAAMARLFDNLALTFIEDVAKMLIKAAALQTVNAFGGAGGNLSKAIGGEVPQALGGSQSNSANPMTAAITQLTTYLGLNTTAQTVATAATSANTATTGVATVQGAAATAENTIATIGNTIAVDALKIIELAKSLLPSFDVGSWSVPGDMVAQIHSGEMIIPAGPASQIRNGAALGGSTSSGSGGNYTININAIDTQTGAQFLKQNAGVIAASLSSQARNFNPNLRT